MIVQIVQFETTLNATDTLAAARSRLPDYRAVPGLLQKYYVDLGNNRYSGILIWESAAALAAFRETELAQTIGQAYSVKGAPDVAVGQLMFPLRDMAEAPAHVA